MRGGLIRQEVGDDAAREETLETVRRVRDDADRSVQLLVAARDRKRPGPVQRELFAPLPDPVLAELRALELDDVSPRQALDLLRGWQQRARGDGK